ncbi:MAG: amidohydrolase family protein, partial [Isosphaeraceae bacterium]
GDWPVCLLGGTYSQWVTALRQIAEGRSKADQRKLFHDNAVRIYRLA